MNISDLDSARAYLVELYDKGDFKTLNSILEKVEYENTFNKSAYFKPYPFQTKMFDAGSKHIARFACVGNRCGKTHSGCMELSYHLTGRYPTMATHGWEWNGHKFTNPTRCWAIGITGETTRKVLQLELIGTMDIRDTKLIGTGTLPLDAIDIDTIEKDGPASKVLKIKHVSGGYSILEFRSTQQGHMALAGAAVDFILMDEEDEHDSLAIYSQGMTRLATTNGKMLITATPENGVSDLIQKFYNTPELFIFHAGWNDAPHLTEEIKKDLMAAIPEWQIPMRCDGIPSKGSGAIFQVDDEDITVEPFAIPDHWYVCHGLDFGRSKDPSVIVTAAYDHSTKTVYLINEEYLDQDRSPEHMAEVILGSEFPSAPVIPPHDGNSISADGGSETRASIMKRLGVNMFPDTFSNPPEVQNRIADLRKKSFGLVGGLEWMAHLMKTNRFKVFNTLDKFFVEKRSYFYVERGNKSVPRDKDNHVIDASRIASLSVAMRGKEAILCRGFVEEQPIITPSWAY